MNKNLDQDSIKNKNIYKQKALTPFKRVQELAHCFIKSLPMFIKSNNSKKYLEDINLSDWYSPSNPVKQSQDLVITWIGNSSFLIQISRFNILVDPIFYDSMFLFKRVLPAGIDINNLPKIDFILISHDHADHMNYKSLLELKKHNAIILTPMGTKRWFENNKFENVFEFDWWQNFVFTLDTQTIEFNFLPAVHWSGRSINQINKSLWGSWMITANNKNIYFAGDTAYDNHFKDIAQKFNSIDVALLPISPVEPRKIVKYSHIDSFEAVKAFIDLNANNFIPMHWGTFKANLDTFYLPVQKLNQYWAEQQNFLGNKKLHVLKFGQSIQF